MNTPTQQTGGESATPRTDAAAFDIRRGSPDYKEDGLYVYASIARQLERETATLHAQIARMTEALEMAQERIAELSKWAGIPNEGQTNDEITAALQSVAKEGEQP